MEAPATPQRRSSRALHIVLGAWAMAVVIVGAYQLAAHASSLPAPRDSTRLAQAMRALGREATGRRALVAHFLGAQCGCSRDVVRSLARRAPIAGAHEYVFVIGSARETRALLAGRGYVVDELDADAAARRFDLEAVPVLVVALRDAGVRYVGGYTERKRDGQILTTSIVARILADARPSPLPVLGCAVSRRLRQQLDPLGVR